MGGGLTRGGMTRRLVPLIFGFVWNGKIVDVRCLNEGDCDFRNSFAKVNASLYFLKAVIGRT